jgi:hypothetical protein
VTTVFRSVNTKFTCLRALEMPMHSNWDGRATAHLTPSARMGEWGWAQRRDGDAMRIPYVGGHGTWRKQQELRRRSTCCWSTTSPTLLSNPSPHHLLLLLRSSLFMLNFEPAPSRQPPPSPPVLENVFTARRFLQLKQSARACSIYTAPTKPRRR